MSRNNDSLPMLPPWLSESDVTQVGYEAPVENLPQDDEIDEAPKRRRFMGRGDDAPRKEKGRRRRKADEEAAQQSAPSAQPVDQRHHAEPTPQSSWSTQPPADPLIPGPSHQQPSRDYPQPPSREQSPPVHEQSPHHRTGRDAAAHQPVPGQPSVGRQTAPNPLAPQPNVASPTDSTPWSNTHGPSATTGPAASDSMPWNTGRPGPTSSAPWPTGRPPVEHAPTSAGQTPSHGTPPSNGPLPTGGGTGAESAAPSPTSASPTQSVPSAHAGPVVPAPPAESTDHGAGALPTRTPAPPSNGFTPLGPTQQRPELPPPPPLPDPPVRPTQAPPRLTVPPQSVTPSRDIEQPADSASQSVPPRDEHRRSTTGTSTTPVPDESASSRREVAQSDSGSRPVSSGEVEQAQSQAAPSTQATGTPDSAAATTAAEPTDSPTTGARHAVGGWSMPDEDAPATTPHSPETPATATEPQAPWDPFADGTPSTTPGDTSHSTPAPTAAGAPESQAPTPAVTPESHSPSDSAGPDPQPDAAQTGRRSPHAAGESAAQDGSPYSSGESVAPQSAQQRSPYASGETVQPSTYPATQYNSVPGDPTPVAPTPGPDGRTEVFRSDDPRLQGRGPGAEQASRQGGAQTGYRSGEFVQAADAVSPYPRPDGTPAQHQQPDGLPTYGPDGVAVRPDGAAQQRPDAAPTQHQHPDGSPAQPYQPDGTPAPQYQQPNQGAQQQFLPNGPSQPYQPDRAPAQQPHGAGQQYLPDGTPAPQYQQPNGPGPQYLPDGTPAPQYQQPNGPGQYLPDGTHAQQYQQPVAAPQQYQQPGNYQQPQQPYGQPGWGAQPQGYQPSLDNVPVKRAKKAPGSGWRKAVHHVSGGAINPGMSAEELRLQELVARIRQPVRGDYRIAVLSLKGGVGKTTTTTGLGSIFASIRGDRVIAVDANPDFGTLSQRVAIQTRSTVRDLLLDPSIQRYSDVRRHTSQGSSRLEVLASERDPAASEAFNDEEYRAVARILQRFYNIILTDCGTGLMHSAMSGVLDLAHSLVLISSAAIDGARSAAATLDWLSLHGHDHLVRNAVVVINLPREGSPNVGIQQLREYFLSRCRAVHIIPFDEHLSEGAEIDLHRLHKGTKRAYVELAATVADEFGAQHHRLS
ncbi:AAA family ATPase [Nocardia sp. NPDC058633]|uniref:MinD/ParA family ATP-binding protein n=1 Tax=Nocardia sp. NPDC058633 TaxID=3346568 RepID=UPI003655A2D9